MAAQSGSRSRSFSTRTRRGSSMYPTPPWAKKVPKATLMPPTRMDKSLPSKESHGRNESSVEEREQVSYGASATMTRRWSRIHEREKAVATKETELDLKEKQLKNDQAALEQRKNALSAMVRGLQELQVRLV